MDQPSPEQLRVENARLRAALQFYAAEGNWLSPSKGFAAQFDPEPSAIDRAGRYRFAAEVLANADAPPPHETPTAGK